MTAHPTALAFAANQLPDIGDAERRLDSEAHVFSEIKAVLEKHGLAKKYGLTLLHKHFDLAEDEVLVEYTDVENRTLVSRPVKADDASLSNSIETVWSLDNDSVMGQCVNTCYFSGGRHVTQHRAAGP